MIQINELSWKADKGMTFRRKCDGFIMGSGIQLGINQITNEYDAIDNYEEIVDDDYKPEEEIKKSNKLKLKYYE